MATQPSRTKSYRIVHVTNSSFKPKKVYLHSTAAKLSNGWTRAGHHVINFSDRDMARWLSPFGFREAGKKAANNLLIKLCLDVKPDIIAFGHADIITPRTLEILRQKLPTCKMMQWNMDWWVPLDHALPEDGTASGNRYRILGKRDFLDATFITTAGLALSEIATSSHIAGFLPNPYDHSLERHRNFENTSLPDNIFFTSNSKDDRRYHCGKWQHMDEFCTTLQNRLPDQKCAFYGINGASKCFGPQYEDAMSRARVGLNISRRNDAYLYSSDRLAHMIGNGLTICIDRATGYDDIFDDSEMVFYSTEDELIEKLDRLGKDDQYRMKIGESGWRKYSTIFDGALIAQYMIDVLNSTHNPDKYVWQTTT